MSFVRLSFSTTFKLQYSLFLSEALHAILKIILPSYKNTSYFSSVMPPSWKLQIISPTCFQRENPVLDSRNRVSLRNGTMRRNDARTKFWNPWRDLPVTFNQEPLHREKLDLLQRKYERI